MPEPKKIRNQCRYLKPDGEQCLKVARSGQHFCHKHLLHRSPKMGYTTHTVPLLDNVAAIQLVVTQVVQGTLANTLDAHQSSRLLYGLQIASNLLAQADTQAHRAHLRNKDKNIPTPEPVEEVTVTEDGEELAPEQRYLGPNGKTEVRWDLGKWFYVAGLRNKTIQEVTEEEVAETEFPEEGYLTEEEMANPQLVQDLCDGKRDKELLAQLKQGTELRSQDSKGQSQATGSRQQAVENSAQGAEHRAQEDPTGIEIQACVEKHTSTEKCRERRKKRVPQVRGVPKGRSSPGDVRRVPHSSRSEGWASASEGHQPLLFTPNRWGPIIQQR